MKNHIIDITIGAEDNTTMTTALTTIATKVGTFGIHLDDAQRNEPQQQGFATPHIKMVASRAAMALGQTARRS